MSESHRFVKIVFFFLHIFLCEIKRRLRHERVAMEGLGKSIKSRDVSLETKAKNIDTVVFPITYYIRM